MRQLPQSLHQQTTTYSPPILFENLADNSIYDTLTGISRSQFESILSSVPIRGCGEFQFQRRNSLAVLLMKLRTGLSHSHLATLFRVSKQAISRRILATTKLLLTHFVGKHIGKQIFNRENCIQNQTSEVTRQLFGSNKLVIVCDSTYIYIQKSQHFKFARKTYSSHKYRPLIKFMISVSTDGTILDVAGPYFADGRNSDGNILNHQLESGAGIFKFMKSNDILVVDRGFQAAKGNISQKGIHFLQPLSPNLKDNNRDATLILNASRVVTKLRWVVECAHARIKTWKWFSSVVSNHQLNQVEAYISIVAAIINAFRVPLVRDIDFDPAVITRFKERLNVNNNLAEKIQAGLLSLKRKSDWMEFPDNDDFPILTSKFLENHVCFGTYQIKLARSYAEEHGQTKSGFKIHKNDGRLILGKIQSRHSNAVQYQVLVKYDKSNSTDFQWYCNCKSGRRTAGCCAHVATILWWLGVGRHQDGCFTKKKPRLLDAQGVNSRSRANNIIKLSESPPSRLQDSQGTNVIQQTQTHESDVIQIDESFHSSAATNYISVNGVSVFKSSISTLNPSSWLNDDIINCFLAPLESSKITVFNTHFMTLLETGAYLNRWKQNVNLDQCISIFPICYQNHWILIAVYPHNESIFIFDSLGNGHNYRHLATSISSYLSRRCNCPRYLGFQILEPKLSPQENGFDCGIFIILDAQWLAVTDNPSTAVCPITQVFATKARELFRSHLHSIVY